MLFSTVHQRTAWTDVGSVGVVRRLDLGKSVAFSQISCHGGVDQVCHVTSTVEIARIAHRPSRRMHCVGRWRGPSCIYVRTTSNDGFFRGHRAMVMLHAASSSPVMRSLYAYAPLWMHRTAGRTLHSTTSKLRPPTHRCHAQPRPVRVPSSCIVPSLVAPLSAYERSTERRG